MAKAPTVFPFRPRILAGLALLGLIAGCATPTGETGRPAMPASFHASTPAQGLAARAAATTADIDGAPASAPLIRSGSGVLVRPIQEGSGAAADADGDITLSFVDADIPAVVDNVLGQMLHLNYAIDPKVHGTITMQTSRPLSREAVLPTLEAALQSNGVALVRTPEGVYRIMPLDAAAHAGLASGAAGYGTQIIPLRFASARQLQKTLAPFVPTGGQLQVDDSRNLLLVSGAQGDVRTFARMVAVFDVDWMKGMSFGLFPLHQSSAASVARELEPILNGTAGGAGGMVRIVPIERINQILLVSPQPAFIEQGRSWIEKLDAGTDETAPRLYVFFVQHGRAADLAKVLGAMFGNAAGGGQGGMASTEPGTGMTRLASTGAGSDALGGAGMGRGLGGNGAQGAVLGDPMIAKTAAGSAAPKNDILAVPEAPATAIGHSSGGDSGPGTRIVADEKNNALLIMARPREYRMIQGALQRLDVLPRQVLIEATVAEVTLRNELEYGVQWYFKKGRSRLTLSQLDSGLVAPAFPGFGYVLGGSTAQAILSALSEVTRVNVVSAPQLMVLDHQTAMLQVGDEVPVAVQQAQSVTNPDAPIVNSIQMYNTGVILKVTPRLNANGVATIDIEQEVSDVTKTTTSNIDSPTIQQRRVRTVIAAEDGQTIALGGLIKQNSSRGKSGIPVLSDMPVIGNLFGTTTDNTDRTELLILLTPRVVHDPGEARSVTDELRQRFQAVLPPTR